MYDGTSNFITHLSSVHNIIKDEVKQSNNLVDSNSQDNKRHDLLQNESLNSKTNLNYRNYWHWYFLIYGLIGLCIAPQLNLIYCI